MQARWLEALQLLRVLRVFSLRTYVEVPAWSYGVHVTAGGQYERGHGRKV